MSISTSLAFIGLTQISFKRALRSPAASRSSTNPSDATPGSIRGDLATELDKNVVHGSDSDESAERELNLFFS